MVEKFIISTPDGQENTTWYRLSRQEALMLFLYEVLTLEPGQTLADLVDIEIMAFPGNEAGIEAMIDSWGFSIRTIGRG